MLFMHAVRCAFSFALANAGKSIAASIAMIAMTTSSSMRVKPVLLVSCRFFIFSGPSGRRRLMELFVSYPLLVRLSIRQPLVAVLRDERVIAQVRVSATHAINFFALARSKRFVGVKTPIAFE